MTTEHRPSIVLTDQGSFFVGGAVVELDNGDVLRDDHAYVQYPIPAEIRGLPLVMWH
jgi:hypothetical protein